jgi:hypothetical protein
MTYVSNELRRLVIERAGGCCEYCLLPREDTGSQFHVEHIIATSHEGKTAADNLCLSFAKCNLFKGSNIAAADPETGEPTFMFHPRRRRWDDHFRLDGAIIEPLTAEGRVTAFLLRLNSSVRVEQRVLLLRLGRYPCRPPQTS